MKKIISIAFAAILAGLAISCQKEEAVSDKTDAVQYTFNIIVNDRAGFDNDASTKGSESHKSCWENGDKIFLFFKPTGDNLNNTYATLTYHGSGWGVDAPGLSGLGEDGTLSAVYVYNLDGNVYPEFSSDDNQWTIATGNTFYNCQTGVDYTVSDNVISASLDLLVAPTDFVRFYVEGATGALTCDNVKGWKNIAIGSDMDVSNVTCTGYMDGFTNSGDSNVKEYYGRIVDGTSLDGTSLNGKACNFSVVKNGKVYERTATPSSNARSFKMDISDGNWQEAKGKLPGLFTVGNGADGKAGTADDVQVRFSQGNLWYGKVNDEAETATFNFEANQYSFASSWNTNHVSHFFWSQYWDKAYTETYNDTQATTGDVLFTNATETTAKTDFEVNGQTNVWRTLSLGEWQYLLNSRTVNGGTKAGKSYSLNITYSDISGLVLYPDDYTGSVLSGTVEPLPEGVVFLPQAKRREVSNFINFGFYWSSSPANNVTNASYILFNSSNIGTAAQQSSRSWGMSVRLVSKID